MGDRPTKAQRITEAWEAYRRTALAFPRQMAWVDYLEADNRAWRIYLEAERAILAEKEAA